MKGLKEKRGGCERKGGKEERKEMGRKEKEGSNGRGGDPYVMADFHNVINSGLHHTITETDPLYDPVLCYHAHLLCRFYST